jgi:hypothetical protein
MVSNKTKNRIGLVLRLRGRNHLISSGFEHIRNFIAKPKSLLRVSRGKITTVLLKTSKVASAMLLQGLAEATAQTLEEITHETVTF